MAGEGPVVPWALSGMGAPNLPVPEHPLHGEFGAAVQPEPPLAQPEAAPAPLSGHSLCQGAAEYAAGMN